MKYISILLIGLIFGSITEYYGQSFNQFLRLVSANADNPNSIQSQKLPAKIANAVSTSSKNFLAAADRAEEGDTTAFNHEVYELGTQINASIIASLQLSPKAKEQLEQQLAESYPTIAKDIRESYLQQIKTLKTPKTKLMTSSEYKTKAEILAGAINGNICAFSNLILIPMRLNIGLAGNIAAGYAFNDPCQNLLSGVSSKLADQIFRAGLIKDLDTLQSILSLEKRSAVAQLATSEIQFNIKSSQVINRSVGKIAHWKAASLSIDYSALVQYGYDLSEGFSISRDDNKNIIYIVLPPVKLLQVNLDPIDTDAQDGGIIDLSNANFRTVYQKARQDAIATAIKNGLQESAEEQIKALLNCIYQPFTNASKHPYQLQITTQKSI